ncbi:aminotransferase class IV [Acetivibrio mesophilus]|uniref:Aminodeoxychorismate lyase n=1 Tax=Acetivibrio mesophilus TaxID=2487273 RepID=A0A4Q0I486_9FIRM|nr:aminotransferase class IV [Acetivibrio mesophilus]RXE59100.1 aminodeoxychorismate lyase [Acetivibrio mesophilus]HHV29506.1 aminodeoxychorismate lyase [Clostridium sp.]
MDCFSGIKPDDFGVLYGFSLFETFLVNEYGRVFLIEKHIDRLFDSMRHFGFDSHLTKENLLSMVMDYIKKSDLKNTILRLTVTCGNKNKGIDPAILFSTREYTYSKTIYKTGFRLMVSGLVKNANSPVIAHKTGNYLENYMEGQRALNNGFDDVIFLNAKGEITETSKSNIFFVHDGRLHTPHLSCGLLPGIIRKWVIEKTKDLGLLCEEGHYSLETLLCAEEVFVTNSVIGIVPVNNIDNKLVGSGVRGKIAALLMKELQDVM